jgi:hypothetical protein
MATRRNAPVETEAKLDQAKLDHQKLLGFRNLTEVTRPEGDLAESADLAFQKRGTETAA